MKKLMIGLAAVLMVCFAGSAMAADVPAILGSVDSYQTMGNQEMSNTVGEVFAIAWNFPPFTGELTYPNLFPNLGIEILFDTSGWSYYIEGPFGFDFTWPIWPNFY